MKQTSNLPIINISSISKFDFREEAEKYFGKNYWGLTISRCSEPEFKSWWEFNKELPYDKFYYDVAQYIWDLAEIHQVP